MNDNHIGKEMVSEKIKCLDLVKMNGNNPMKLFVKMNRNSGINSKVIFEFLLPVKILNSLCRIIIIFSGNWLNRDGINQKVGGKIMINRKVLDQFSDQFINDLDGSKMENKLVIIFSNVSGFY
jgi:hypothetical protein